MENPKEQCESLLEKYRDLKQKTALKLFDLNESKLMDESQYNIPMEYFEEFGEVRKGIKECLKFFPDNILFEFFDDFDFRKDIWIILRDRRLK